MNVNFGLFPPLDAPSHDAAGNRIKGKERGAAKKRAHVGPCARRSRPLACRAVRSPRQNRWNGVSPSPVDVWR